MQNVSCNVEYRRIGCQRPGHRNTFQQFHSRHRPTLQRHKNAVGCALSRCNMCVASRTPSRSDFEVTGNLTAGGDCGKCATRKLFVLCGVRYCSSYRHLAYIRALGGRCGNFRIVGNGSCETRLHAAIGRCIRRPRIREELKGSTKQ